MRDHQRGLLMAIAGVLLLSPDALLIRLIGTDPWNLLAWRGLGFVVVIGGASCLRYRGRLISAVRAVGPSGLLVAALFTASSAAFLYSITTTRAANTLVVVATAPLFAAAVSRFTLGERLMRDTLLAIVVALAGVAVTVWGSLGTGRLSGDLAALVTAVLMAFNFTAVRRVRQRDLAPAYVLAGVLMAVTGALLADSLYVPPAARGWLVLLVLVVHPVSFMLIMAAPRYITAPEVALVMLLETALGPLWVWLALGETPPAATLAGGTLIVATLVAYTGRRLAALSGGSRGGLAAVSRR